MAPKFLINLLQSPIISYRTYRTYREAVAKQDFENLNGFTEDIFKELIKQGYLQLVSGTTDQYRVLKVEIESGFDSLNADQIKQFEAVLQQPHRTYRRLF